jgi:anti-sigma B factor antagonist
MLAQHSCIQGDNPCRSSPPPTQERKIKESQLKLSLETRRSGDVIIIHCEGRVVYRDEAAALSRMAGEALEHTREVVLDFGGVQRLDSAGLGELVLVHMSASDQGKLVKLAGAKPHVRELLDLTNLSSVFEIYPTLEDAIEAGDEVATLV